VVPQRVHVVVVAHLPPSGRCLNISLNAGPYPPKTARTESVVYVKHVSTCRLHVPAQVPHFINHLGHDLSAHHLPGVTLKFLTQRTCSCHDACQVNTVPKGTPSTLEISCSCRWSTSSTPAQPSIWGEDA